MDTRGSRRILDTTKVPTALPSCFFAPGLFSTIASCAAIKEFRDFTGSDINAVYSEAFSLLRIGALSRMVSTTCVCPITSLNRSAVFCVCSAKVSPLYLSAVSSSQALQILAQVASLNQPILSLASSIFPAIHIPASVNPSYALARLRSTIFFCLSPMGE